MFDLARYAEHGFAAPLPVMTEQAADALHQRVAAIYRDYPDQADQALSANCHLLFPWLYDLTRDNQVLDAVETVNGGAKRDHLGGVRRDRLAAAGLSP